MDDYDEHLK